jgi:hypothetical protein
MVTVPADAPPTIPPDVMVALVMLALDQTPGETDAVRDIVAPSHTIPVPDIVPASGRGFTVTVTDATAVPQPFVTE